MNCTEFIALKSGNGLLVFSDPAGAKACLALGWLLLQNKDLTSIRLCSNKHHSFYEDWNLNVEIIPDPANVCLDNTDWIFTGTSHPDSSDCFELKVLERALEKGMPSASFIDHWTSLSLRFTKDNVLLFPDTVYVADPEILSAAKYDGIPAGKLAYLENPYSHFIQNHWKSSVSKAEFRKVYGVRENVKSIFTYAPDPISLRHPFEKYGFDENSVLEELLAYFSNHPNRFLLIKTHPLQPVDVFQDLILKSNIRNYSLKTERNLSNLEIIQNSTAIIGFFSNFLLEARLLNKPILRYQPSTSDEFSGIFEKFTIPCRSMTELDRHLTLIDSHE